MHYRVQRSTSRPGLTNPQSRRCKHDYSLCPNRFSIEGR